MSNRLANFALTSMLNVVYLTAFLVLSPWILWRRIVKKKNRRGWKHKLLGKVPRRHGDRKCIWMHAVSVGEVNLLAPILREFRTKTPNIEIWISTTTESGFDLAQQKYPEYRVFFCPADFSWAIKRTLRRVRPDMLVLAELEFWPNLIRITADAGVAVSIVNARMSDSSFRGYWRLRHLLRPVFKRLTLVAGQNQLYCQRFAQLGCREGVVRQTGSVKFDGAMLERNNPKTLSLRKLAAISDDEFVLVAGSTQEEEDLMAASVWQNCASEFPQLKLILAPRHPGRCPQLMRKLNEMGIQYTLRSQLNRTSHENPHADCQRVLIVDGIGELGAWWGVADLAYVGGSMGRRGGQNMIEPAAFGVPTCFGPKTENFRDVVQMLLSMDAARVVQDAGSLEKLVRSAVSEKGQQQLAEMANRAKKLTVAQQGASASTAQLLIELVGVRTPASGENAGAKAA